MRPRVRRVCMIMATPPPRRPSTAATRVSVAGVSAATASFAVTGNGTVLVAARLGMGDGTAIAHPGTMAPDASKRRLALAIRCHHAPPLDGQPAVCPSRPRGASAVLRTWATRLGRRSAYARNVRRTYEEHRPGSSDAGPRSGICSARLVVGCRLATGDLLSPPGRRRVAPPRGADRVPVTSCIRGSWHRDDDRRRRQPSLGQSLLPSFETATSYVVPRPAKSSIPVRALGLTWRPSGSQYAIRCARRGGVGRSERTAPACRRRRGIFRWP